MRYALPILLFPLLAACSPTEDEEVPQVEFVEELTCAQVPPPPVKTDGLWSAATDQKPKPATAIPAPLGATVSEPARIVEDAVNEAHEDPSDKPDNGLAEYGEENLSHSEWRQSVEPRKPRHPLRDAFRDRPIMRKQP